MLCDLKLALILESRLADEISDDVEPAVLKLDPGGSTGEDTTGIPPGTNANIEVIA